MTRIGLIFLILYIIGWIISLYDIITNWKTGYARSPKGFKWTIWENIKWQFKCPEYIITWLYAWAHYRIIIGFLIFYPFYLALKYHEIIHTWLNTKI